MIFYQLPNNESNREQQGFSAVDIQLPTMAVNVAEICLTSRYPETGSALNRRSEMVVIIFEGKVIFHCEGEEVLLPQGSTVLVQTNKPYHWVPQGGFVRMFVVSSPPWTPEQHTNVPE